VHCREATPLAAVSLSWLAACDAVSLAGAVADGARIREWARAHRSMPASRATRDGRARRAPRDSGTLDVMASRAEDARTDESLLTAHLEGDPRALELLIRRYKDELHGFLTRFLGSSAAADDVFQETFLQVHLAGATFDATRTFKPWLFTIAANKARDFHRKRKRRAMASLDAPVASSGDSTTLAELVAGEVVQAGADLEAADEATRMQRTISELPEHHREIILLGYFQRLSYQQIADVLSIPLGTVKSRMHAAVASFSQRWIPTPEQASLAARTTTKHQGDSGES